MDLEFDLIWHDPWCGDMSLKVALRIVSHCSGQECNSSKILGFFNCVHYVFIGPVQKNLELEPLVHFLMFWLKLKQIEMEKTYFLHLYFLHVCA